MKNICSTICIALLLFLMFPSSPSAESVVGSSLLTYKSSTLWTDGWDFVVDGNVGYFLMTPGLLILDLTNPATPDTLSRLPLQLGGLAMTKQGSYLYVAAGKGGVFLIDVSDPYIPIEMGSINVGDLAQGITVVDSLIYVAANNAGMVIINAANPLSLQIVGSFVTAYSAYSVDVQGTRAYIAAGFFGGLRIIDISNPTAPFYLGEFDTPSYCKGVMVKDTLVYLADGWSGLHIVNVSNPVNPVEVGAVDYDIYGQDLYLVDTILYTHDNRDGLYIFSVAAPTNPYLLGHYDSYGRLNGFDLQGTVVYSAEGYLGALFLDVSSPAAISQIGMISIPASTGDVDGEVDFALTTSRWGTDMVITNSSDPTNPFEESKYSMLSSGIYVVDTLAYVASDSALRILNIADLANPIQIGSYPVLWAVDVWVQDTLAYVCGGGGIEIIDVTDPTVPSFVGVFSSGIIYPEQIDVSGNIVVASGETSEYMDVALVLDVTDPTNPVQLNLVWGAQTVLVSSNLLYWAGYQLEILDISNPSSPVSLGTADLPQYGDGIDLELLGNLLYVAAGDSGIRVFDVSNSTAPVEIGSYNTPGSATRIALRDSLLYVADISSLQILAVHEPGPCCVGLTGNIDGDAAGIVDISDLTALIDFLFISNTPVTCQASANTDGDLACLIDVGDLTKLISHLFIAEEQLEPCNVLCE